MSRRKGYNYKPYELKNIVKVSGGIDIGWRFALFNVGLCSHLKRHTACNTGCRDCMGGEYVSSRMVERIVEWVKTWIVSWG